jgi:hypothetical protein
VALGPISAEMFPVYAKPLIRWFIKKERSNPATDDQMVLPIILGSISQWATWIMKYSHV